MSQLAIFYPLVTGEQNPILRKKSAPIQSFDAEVQDFAEVLLTLMYEYDGVGLASPQLGQNIRMIAVTQWKEEKAKSTGAKGKKKKPQRTLIGEYVMINPTILEHSESTQITEEACLSVPNIF
jgi:peptide deformylase